MKVVNVFGQRSLAMFGESINQPHRCPLGCSLQLRRALFSGFAVGVAFHGLHGIARHVPVIDVPRPRTSLFLRSIG
ncbi:MAG: hypothetical protein AABZ47_05715 [Planctomycetota bacterium]